MADRADRYVVRDRQSLASGGRSGSIRKTVWVVWDTNTGKVAKGTTGDGRPGGYESESAARSVANRMNRDLTRALNEKAEREKRRRRE